MTGVTIRPTTIDPKDARRIIENSPCNTEGDLNRRLRAHAVLLDEIARDGATNDDDYQQTTAAALRDICRRLTWVN